ncbi:MAG: GNAT family N-acetyltransferase [Betaproteobacteria bacterium]
MTITIRRATPRDAAAYARMMGEADVFGNLLQMPYADEELWRQRLTDSCAPGKLDLGLVAELDGEVAASAGLHPVGVATRRRHAMMLGISVAGHAQRKGVGTALMRALCDYADGWAGILRIELTVFEDNQRAIALYQKFGFEIEGRHRAFAMRDGQYADALTMARLHPRQPLVNAS